ncbi:hypothetical protein B0A89_10945 [Paracoccus contaminans]|uniref:Uncharacterized protein n=1 Tax=Paracoccus contaminans TaxID=1945662 RepID=A0A1W6CYX6_9RHOB|nr:hypothetical protein B0A89_10945 [Paracoccus contaminans]
MAVRRIARSVLLSTSISKSASAPVAPSCNATKRGSLTRQLRPPPRPPPPRPFPRPRDPPPPPPVPPTAGMQLPRRSAALASGGCSDAPDVEDEAGYAYDAARYFSLASATRTKVFAQLFGILSGIQSSWAGGSASAKACSTTGSSSQMKTPAHSTVSLGRWVPSMYFTTSSTGRMRAMCALVAGMMLPAGSPRNCRGLLKPRLMEQRPRCWMGRSEAILVRFGPPAFTVR